MSHGVVPPESSGWGNSPFGRHLNGATSSAVDDLETDSLLKAMAGRSASAQAANRTNLARRSFSVQELRQLPAQAPHFDSLDLEEIENTVYRADKAASTTLDSIYYTFAKWSICLGIGIVTALAAFTVNIGVENISGFKFWATLTMLERGWYLGSFCIYCAINACLVMLSVTITLFVGPAAAGSGIADVKAYLNGIDVPGIFYFNTLIAKFIGAIGSVAGGLAIGKEGPFVHAGACIAALLSQGGSSTHQLSWFKRFWNDRDRNDFIACGAAAGVAAAFRSPVGGVLFALEEMTSWWKNELLWLIFFTTAVVSVTVRVLMKMCTKHGCGFFGSGGFIIFEIQEGQDNYEFYELLPVLLLGVVGGLLGSGFITLNAKLTLWRKQHLAKRGVSGRMAEALLISLLTSAISFIIPLFFQCQACPVEAGSSCPRQDNSHSGNFVSFACPGQQYNDLATIFFNTQDDAIRNLFSSKTKREYTVSSLITFSTCFYFLAVITYGISCPVGLFVPSILCGASYGRLVGIFVADMHPTHYIDEGTYALLGAASFLGGAMRMTVCTCVMLLELTNNLALLPLVMLVLLVAKAVGDGTGVKPIYELQMELKKMPFLAPTPESFLRHVTAKECCGKPPATLQRVEKVSRIVHTLRSCSHNGFPVIHTNADGSTYIMGVILRQHLLVLLTTRRCMQPSPYVAEVSSRVAISYDPSEFIKPISQPGLSVEDVHLTPEQLELYLDLGPYVNPSYYVVQEDASLSKVYTLFRTLGLRHLCVIPRAPEVVGIITRHDLLPETIEERFEGAQYMTDGTSYHANGSMDGSDGGATIGGLLNRRPAPRRPGPAGLPSAAASFSGYSFGLNPHL